MIFRLSRAERARRRRPPSFPVWPFYRSISEPPRGLRDKPQAEWSPHDWKAYALFLERAGSWFAQQLRESKSEALALWKQLQEAERKLSRKRPKAADPRKKGWARLGSSWRPDLRLNAREVAEAVLFQKWSWERQRLQQLSNVDALREWKKQNVVSRKNPIPFKDTTILNEMTKLRRLTKRPR